MTRAAIDPHTLVFAVALLGLLTASLTLSLARASGEARPAILEWSWGMLCVGLAFLLLFFRGHLPIVSFNVAMNALVLAFPIFALRAYSRLFRAPMSVRVLRTLYVLQVAGLVVYHLLDTPREIAVVVLCTMLTSEFAIIARLILQRGGDMGRPVRWMAAGTMIVLAFLFAMRVVATLAGASPSIDPSARSTLQIVTLLLTSVALVGSTISFTLMVHERHYKSTIEAAKRDDVTGLLTRKAFFDALGDAARDDLSSPMALVMVDVDHFKRINDRYGHMTGDAVLAAVGALVLESIRTDDVAGRYGGEEFCLMLRNCSATDAERFCRRLVETAAEQRIRATSGEEVTFTLSAGFAVQCEASVFDVLERADAALYDAKRAGRNRAIAAAGGDVRIDEPFPTREALATIPV